MAKIKLTEALPEFSGMLIDVYRERVSPSAFLRSFFPSVESGTKQVSIEVERGTERIAVDVIRGDIGNRNAFGRSTLTSIIPPYYREYFDMTELDVYDRIFGSVEVDDKMFAEYISDVADKLVAITDKIERAYELQCSQVLSTGIVTLKNDDNIDFKRKAASKVDVSSQSWAGSNDPYAHISAGGDFLRSVGKVSGGVLNLVLGSSALTALMTNEEVRKRNDLKNINLDAIRLPQKNAVGGVLHGEMTAGTYQVRLWSYPEVYDNASGVSVPYLDSKQAILLPENPRFKMAFGAVPQLIKSSGIDKRAYVIGEKIDEYNAVHQVDVKSAGIAVPVAVDQIYTMKVVV